MRWRKIMLLSSLPEEWVDYVYLERGDLETIPVKLLTGKYEGVILQFGTVRIKEDESGNFATLSFTYKVLEPQERKAELDSDGNFKDYIGKVLNSTILGVTDEVGESDTEILDEIPRVRTKGPSVSQE